MNGEHYLRVSIVMDNYINECQIDTKTKFIKKEKLPGQVKDYIWQINIL